MFNLVFRSAPAWLLFNVISIVIMPLTFIFSYKLNWNHMMSVYRPASKLNYWSR